MLKRTAIWSENTYHIADAAKGLCMRPSNVAAGAPKPAQPNGRVVLGMCDQLASRFHIRREEDPHKAHARYGAYYWLVDAESGLTLAQWQKVNENKSKKCWDACSGEGGLCKSGWCGPGAYCCKHGVKDEFGCNGEQGDSAIKSYVCTEAPFFPEESELGFINEQDTFAYVADAEHNPRAAFYIREEGSIYSNCGRKTDKSFLVKGWRGKNLYSSGGPDF